MKKDNYTIRTKKVGAGHYEITVLKNYESKMYVETDMHIIDALNDDDPDNFYTEAEAIDLIISKAGF